MKNPTTCIGAFFLFIILVLLQAFQVKFGIRDEIDVTFPKVERTTRLDYMDRTHDWNYIVTPTRKTTVTEPGDDSALLNITFGGIGGDIINASEAADDGSIIFVGNSSSSGTALGSFTSGWKMPFGTVAKISSGGDLLWSRGIGGNAMTSVRDCAVLDDGSVVAVGYTMATNIVDTSASPANVVKCFIFRYSSSGTLTWSFCPQSSGYDYLYAVDALPGGGYVVAGSSSSSDGFFNFKSSMPGAVIMAFNSANERVWARALESSTGAQFNGIDVDRFGNIFAALTTNSHDADLAAFDGLGMGDLDSLICRYDLNGELEWGCVIAGSGSESFTRIAADDQGGCCAAGYYNTPHDSGRMSGTLADYFNFGGEDGFAFFIGSDGTVRGGVPIAGIEDDRVTDVKLIGGGFAFSGYSKSYNRIFADVGNYGDFDAFLVMTDLNGEITGFRSMAGSECDRAFTVCGRSAAGVFVGGATSSDDEFFAASTPVPRGVDTAFAVKYRF